MQPETSHSDCTHCADPHKVQVCMFVSEPFFECHCMSISSANIPKILDVCGDKFRSCSIYRREIEKRVFMATDEGTGSNHD
jgi:hypothetical protein